MSDSPNQPLTRITIFTGDPVTEIFLIDSNLDLVERAVGILDVQQPPGRYEVKLRAGTTTFEELIKVEKESFRRSYPPLEFSSPVPLDNTYKTHESHCKNAKAHSRKKHVDKGSGSFIYLFARDWTSKQHDKDPESSGPYPHPARGLTLLDKTGRELVNFEEESDKDLDREPWAACNVSIDPGSYILRLKAPDGSVWERTLVASPKWQTQCFLLQRAYNELRGPDLSGATVLLKNQDLGFEPDSYDSRLMELARLGLTNEHQILSKQVENILTRKFNNPLLGIFGAHLLLQLEQTRGRTYEADLLQIVVKNLRKLLKAPHPDVEALAWHAGLGDPNYYFETPPMMRRGWSLIANASAQSESDIMPADSLTTRIYNRIVAEEPWLVWAGEDRVEEDSPAIETLALYLQSRLPEEETEEPAAHLFNFDNNYASVEPPQGTPDETDLVRELTKQLSLPKSVVERYLPKAREKAKHLVVERRERSRARRKRGGSEWV
jgi:hypothetical protein